MKINVYHHHGDESPPGIVEIQRNQALIIRKLELLMIDTSRILAEVARERTELASWKALVAGLNQTMSKLADDLKAAIAANDPAAMAQVQVDLDKAATDLAADNDDAAAAIAANAPPA